MRHLRVTAALLFWCGLACASEGNQVLGLGPIQEGLAGAGAAAAQDATWVLINPASLVDVQTRFDAYLMSAYITRSLEPRGWGLASNKFAGEMIDDRPTHFPSMALTLNRGDHAFGTGIMGIGGGMIDLDHSRSTLARWKNADRRTSLEIAAIPFAYARRFDNGWALGGALLVEVSRMRTDSITLFLRPTRGDYEWDYALGAGFLAGAYRQWETWAVGLSYRFPQHMQDFDRYDDLTRLPTTPPPQAQAGLAWRPRADLLLLADYKYIAWSASTPFGARTIPTAGLEWDDQHVAKVAVQWDLDDRWTVRGGLSHGKAPIDKRVVFKNGHFPLTVETHAALGLTWRLDDRHQVHLGYSHAFEKHMTGTRRGDLFSWVGAGTRVGLEQDFITLGYSRRFGLKHGMM